MANEADLKLIQIPEFPTTDTLVGSGPEYVVITKADGVTYNMLSSDFKAFLGTVQVQVPKALAPTDPAPTLSGVYYPTVTQNEAGTPIVYANAGGIEVNTAEGGADHSSMVQLIYDGSSWVKVGFPIEVTPVEITNELSIEETKAISPKGVLDALSNIADIPARVEVNYFRGFWHSSKTLISDEGTTQKYLSTGLMPTTPGTVISLRGYKSGGLSNDARIQVWKGSVMSTINIGLSEEYTYIMPEGATNYAVVVAFEGAGADPEPFKDTFQMVIGENFDYNVKLTKSNVLDTVEANDFFQITPNIPIILDKTKPYKTFMLVQENGTVLGSASNNLTFDRIEVKGGALISTSPVRAIAEYDANDNFIAGTWKGSISNFQSHTFETHPETKYLRVTVPYDGGAGVTSYLEDFRIIYGDDSELSTEVIYDLKTVGGGKLNVHSSDSSNGSGGSTDSVLDREQVNINRNDIIKHEIETREMFNSLITIKGSASEEKAIAIPGKGQALDNYVQRFHIHHGAQMGDIQFDEVFMNGSCKTDFSDLRFIDEDGNLLDFSIHSHGNYEFIKDNQVLLNNVVQFTSDGKLVMSYSNSGTSRNLRISSDNGANWTILHNNVMLLFVDSADSLFVFRHDNYTMYRLLASEGYSTLHAVLDLSATQSDIRPLAGFCEDSDGNLYCGKYQEAWDTQIFKSTDGGASWVSVFRDQVNNQHVHHISYDPYQDVIYAGLDGAKNYLDPVKRAKNIKSTDGGGTWAVVPNPYPNSDYGLAFYGDGYRLGFGETGILGGPTIYKTYNDVDYYPVLNTNQGIRKIIEINGVLYAGGNAGQASRNAQMYMSEDKGETWKTVFWEDWQNTSSAGDAVRYFSDHQIPMGGTEAQTIIGGNGAYSRLRLFTGGSHFQALVFVKVGSLPSTGRTIKVVTDYMVKYPSKQVQSEINISGLKGKLPLNEGRGRSVLDVVSGKLSSGDIRWQGVSRRFDSPYPFSLRDYLSSGIKIGSGIMELPDNFNLPHKNFTVTFFGNFFGDYSTSKKFLLGDPGGIHFYYQNTAIYVSNGINDYVCFGLEVPLIQDFYNFYALTVTNDATPNFKFTIGDYQFLTRAMTTWANVTSNKTHLLGTDSSDFVAAKMGIHSLQVYNRALSDFEVRQIYFGSDIV